MKSFHAISICLFALVFNIQAQLRIQCDALGNTYEIFADHITKHSSNFNIDFRISTLQYGTSAQLDLTNPLVPFLFFEDQSSLLFLDNTLNVFGEPVFLNDKFQGQITCVGGSKGDAFWLYNANESTLIRTNRQFEILSKSAYLSPLSKSSLQPKQIIENGQRIYFIDSEKGILLFSLFGQLESQTIYSVADYVYQWNNFIFFRMGNMLFSWENNSPKPEVLCYFNTDELRNGNSWFMCEGKPFYFEPSTGIKREIPILENLEK